MTKAIVPMADQRLQPILAAIDTTLPTWCDAGRPVIVAVSGGIDSMVLWHALATDGRWPLMVFHLHHGLRADADDDEALIRSYANEMGSGVGTIYCERAEVADLARRQKRNLEETGRQERYQRLAALAQKTGAGWVLTAHHRDDQAETVLANSMRGAGTLGLAGMPIQRTLVPGVQLGRPLLPVSRATIQTYAAAADVPWREDHTNYDLSFKRNRIRHEILPQLRTLRPDVVSTLVTTAERAQEKIAVLDQQVASFMATCTASQLDVSELASAPRDVRMHAWLTLARQLDLPRERTWFERCDALVCGPVGRRLAWGRLLFLRRSNTLTWAPRIIARDASSVLIGGPGTYHRTGATLQWREVERRAPRHTNPWHALLDVDAIQFPVQWRLAHAGERFRPLGAPGRQTMSKLLAGRGVASQERAAVAVLADAQGIVWVPGHVLAERVRVHETTTRCALLTVVSA